MVEPGYFKLKEHDSKGCAFLRDRVVVSRTVEKVNRDFRLTYGSQLLFVLESLFLKRIG